MSKRSYYGGDLDRIFKSNERRMPRYQVIIWNPNRCNLQDVVLDRAESPMYDISDSVKSIDYKENIVFENSDDALATNCKITLAYNPNHRPIPIDERTMLDRTPIRIYQGDERIPKNDWVLVFTGVIRGNPTVVEHDRGVRSTTRRNVVVAAVGRAEKYLNKVIVGRSYAKDNDIGKCAIETAIEFMNLERREIDIGDQQYPLKHTQSQMVDIEVMSGIHQMLFCVGKKPRFNHEGKLIAADTNLSKPPARIYKNKEVFLSIVREQNMTAMNNSVRLLGLDYKLTEIVEREKRLAHGNLTSGYFESSAEIDVWFSESPGKQSGGRKAKDTWLEEDLHGNKHVGANMSWRPFIEEDGYTVFGGEIYLDTGFAPWIRGALAYTYLLLIIATAVVGMYGVEQEETILRLVADLILISILVVMMILGRVEWEIFGKPVQNVFKQLCSTAQLAGILTEDIKELEIRNDWLYDIDILTARAHELLKRELVKSWSYKIEMLDDPVLDVDDIIQIVDKKYYITSINKILTRPAKGTSVLTAWRIA